jgi:hypothetical protein
MAGIPTGTPDNESALSAREIRLAQVRGKTQIAKRSILIAGECLTIYQ